MGHGASSLEELVDAARELGLSYLALTDRLDERDLALQRRKIVELNAELGGRFSLLAGVEVLIGEGLSVRRNFPYFGDTDAFTTSLRRRLPAARYLGIEIELNQRTARRADGERRLGAALVAAVEAVLRG